MPKVSVLMPVYNAERYLSEAIDSIVDQQFDDWELVVINDGSTDNSEAIIKSYADARIIYHKNETNLGLIKTLNKGIDLCAGKYIARMDSDDVAHRHRLAKQVTFMDNNPKCAMCGTDAKVIDNDGKTIGNIKNITSSSLLKINLLFSVPFIHPSVMIQRHILLDERYDERYKDAEDYELWCRIAKKCPIANIEQQLLSYRWHATNVSVTNTNNQEVVKEKIICLQLADLGIIPTEEEMYCHKATFVLYKLGVKQDVTTEKHIVISAWFNKLVQQNKKKKIYNHSNFAAYVWSRWCVLCLSQKKYSQIFSPKFTSMNPIILFKLARLILFLRKK